MNPQTASLEADAGVSQASWTSTDPTEGAAHLSQFISFAIGGDYYGVDIMAVREIKGWVDVKHLPKQPEYVRGVLNLRGSMVPIIDLRCRFGQGMTEATPLNVIVVVQIQSQLVGLLADRVSDIISFDADKAQPVPKVAQAGRLDFLSGLITIDGTMIALIDLPDLLAASGDTDDAERQARTPRQLS